MLSEFFLNLFVIRIIIIIHFPHSVLVDVLNHQLFWHIIIFLTRWNQLDLNLANLRATVVFVLGSF